MDNAWFLVLDPPSADATRRVGGLSLVLRLCLEAQAAGASAIVLTNAAAHLRNSLLDSRLTIPVVDGPPPTGGHSIRAPASYLVHPLFYASMADNPGIPGAKLPRAFAPIDVVDGTSARRAEAVLFTSLRKPADGWTAQFKRDTFILFTLVATVLNLLGPLLILTAITSIGLAAT